MTREHIRTWRKDTFRLDLWDTHERTARGTTRLAYRFRDAGEIIFEGDSLDPSPLNSIDGDETVADLLTFLSLKPGDTDPDYFDDYTPRQLRFAEERGELLSLYASDLEEGRS